MNVPFLNLRAAHDPLKAEILSAIQQVIESSAFAGGSFVTRFDEEFAAYSRTKYSIGLGTGTEALWLPLLALGISAGDEVITVPSTFMATAEAITYCGAKPVFVDIEENTYTMNPALLEKAITPKTKAIIPVHLFGQTADMDPILEIAGRHGIPVIEDACQAHGAEYKGRRAGSLGIAGAFSFYPGKNLGAMGEAGSVTTNDATLKARVETLRDHGQQKKYHHSMIGWNARMDGMQGAILSIKLKHLERGNEARRTNASLYHHLLAGEPNIILPQEAEGRRHVYHLYAIRTPKRDSVIEALAKRSISCGIHYPIPVHLQEAYQSLGLGKGSFPVAERCAQDFISLPMFPELTQDQIETVATELKLAVRSV
jgi:dTDP-4-amino-4,6-dideoxygalactose transaminase